MFDITMDISSLKISPKSRHHNIKQITYNIRQITNLLIFQICVTVFSLSDNLI